IVTGLSIDEIDEREDRVFLRSSMAFPVEAKKVIVTTNAFAKNLLPDIDVHGARNHVLVTEPIQDLKLKGCFHYDKGFYYFRNIGNRILLGGGRNKDLLTEATDQFGQNPVIIDTLMKFLYDHLADTGTKIEFQWSGIIALGQEKMPIIRQLSARIYAGVRCSGMGIALASLTGDDLADLVCNSTNESFVN
ncbi:MAG TPA: FAD-dependent oxidoreductase, partial [Saprospiraceae bacterium]|nr:FAD-dependent oxidoreductase [Saprospiraceae bacterium]